MFCYLSLSLPYCHVFFAAVWSSVGKGLTSGSYSLVYGVFFVTFLCGVMGQMLYLIVPIPDICLLSYFYELTLLNTYMDYDLNRMIKIKAYFKYTYGVYIYEVHLESS